MEVAEVEGDARRILRGRWVLWQHSKRDDLFLSFQHFLLKAAKAH